MIFNIYSVLEHFAIWEIVSPSTKLLKLCCSSQKSFQLDSVENNVYLQEYLDIIKYPIIMHCPSNSITLSIIFITFLILFFSFTTKYTFRIKRLKSFNFNEYLIEWIGNQYNTATPFLKKKFFLFFYILFLFIFFSNFAGLFPFFETITVYLIINLFFSFFIQFGLIIYSYHLYGVNFIRAFLPVGVPSIVAYMLLPMEIISFLTRILSLALRLFANMFAGHCTLSIIGLGFFGSIEFLGLNGIIAIIPIFIVFILIFLLEVAIAFLQAYVFLSLVVIYLNLSLKLH